MGINTHTRVTGPVPKSGEEGGEGEGERSGREWAVGGPTESYFGSAIIKHLKTHENHYQTKRKSCENVENTIA